MKVLSVRYCTVNANAEPLAKFFDALGLPRKAGNAVGSSGTFTGAIFVAAENWIEVWPTDSGMAEQVILQIVVDDADAFAARARDHGLHPQGPVNAHGERIYFLKAPTGLQISIQSST